MINIIGDSHVYTFKHCKKVSPHWLGARTCFNIWKQNKIIKSVFDTYGKDDLYWFCLGEIDCQRHIYNKHITTGVEENFLISNTVWLYLKYVNLFREFNIGVMAAPPQGTVGNIFEYEEYTTREHRQEISNMFDW